MLSLFKSITVCLEKMLSGFFGGKMKIGKGTFVHKTAVIEGDVEIGENCSVWPNAVIRGDEGSIRIGNNTSIQDNCVLHNAVEIGENVTVGHAAIVHGCKIGNNVIVGMNATILTGAEIGNECIIAAGSVVREGQKIPSGVLVAGVPAEIKRPLSDEDKKRICWSCQVYTEKAKRLLEKNKKARISAKNPK
ncbi:MAG: gamma carbonic anhydrase family protein [Candidatus Diapherotrites archaeon]